MFGNACTWLANLANASCHNQIWYASYQLIASWCPYKEITCYKQHYICTEFVWSCSVLLEYYDFNLSQSCMSWILYIHQQNILLCCVTRKEVLSYCMQWRQVPRKQILMLCKPVLTSFIRNCLKCIRDCCHPIYQ